MVNKVMVVEGEFEHLPEDVIANILSFTTPRDACVLSLVSSFFKSAAESDVVWEKFLPSDYHAIISQSSNPITYTSKKDLYLQLCHTPLLIDDGNKSFRLDKVNGKKCYMLSARSLFIVWGDTPRYWRWTNVPTARFWEVAELVSVCWLEIKGVVKSSMLSPNTLYAAYLVFKQRDAGAYGFENQPVEVEVSVGAAGGGGGGRRTVYLEAATPRRPRHQIVPRIFSRVRSRFLDSFDAAPPLPSAVEGASGGGGEYPRERGDGWMEVELGEVLKGGGEGEEEVEIGVYEVKSGEWKGGILVQGIEIRPKLKN
ncbi:putative F-box protein PP2-B12 [Cajanus cajan]|uniref:F-box protein PP2-B1 n=1 Tax=Cajanus cajan TaxID=3821 RepID=A0A151TY21_CAJCA|nr:putative F-box protein PP2-B12 [Cajanus cajan]KYP71864.1 F-box protein PP2-B1 [Cajanus cajan]